jgi:hypothetical protein
VKCGLVFAVLLNRLSANTMPASWKPQTLRGHTTTVKLTTKSPAITSPGELIRALSDELKAHVQMKVVSRVTSFGQGVVIVMRIHACPTYSAPLLPLMFMYYVHAVGTLSPISRPSSAAIGCAPLIHMESANSAAINQHLIYRNGVEAGRQVVPGYASAASCAASCAAALRLSAPWPVHTDASPLWPHCNRANNCREAADAWDVTFRCASAQIPFVVPVRTGVVLLDGDAKSSGTSEIVTLMGHSEVALRVSLPGRFAFKICWYQGMEGFTGWHGGTFPCRALCMCCLNVSCTVLPSHQLVDAPQSRGQRSELCFHMEAPLLEPRM